MDFVEYLGNRDFGTKHPTLLLWGDQDDIAKPRRAGPLGRCLRSSFPHLDAFWVKGGGHNIQLDSVSTVASAMDDWLRHGDVDVLAAAARSFAGPLPLLLSLTRTELRKMSFPSGEMEGEGQLASGLRAKL